MTITINGTTGISGVDGTAATPAFKGNDSNTGISFGTDIVTINTGGQARVTTDASGNVGIGTVTPASDARLTLSSANTESYVMFARTNSGVFDAAIGNNGGSIVFKGGVDSSTVAGLNELARLDSSGNLGLGVTPSAWSTASSIRAIQFGGGSLYSFNNDRFFIAQNIFFAAGGASYVNSAEASVYRQYQGTHAWFTAPSGTAGNVASFTQAMTLNASGQLGIGFTFPDQPLAFADSLGTKIQFNGANSNGYQVGLASAVAGGDAMMKFTAGEISPGEIGFYTTTNLRVLINSAGKLLVGTTGLTNGGVVQFSFSDKVNINSVSGSYGQLQIGNATSAGESSICFIPGVTGYGSPPASSNADNVWVAGAAIGAAGYFAFYNQGLNGVVCYISRSSTSWTFTSDERLKTINGTISDALNKVSQLRPVYYNWKNDPGGKQKVGLLAQDVLKVLPEAVTVPENDTDKDGKPAYLGLGMSDVVPLLVSAIQELKAEVDSLKAQLQGAA